MTTLPIHFNEVAVGTIGTSDGQFFINYDVQACHNAFDRSSSVGKSAITVEDIELPERQRNCQIGFVQE